MLNNKNECRNALMDAFKTIKRTGQSCAIKINRKQLWDYILLDDRVSSKWTLVNNMPISNNGKFKITSENWSYHFILTYLG